MEELLRLHRLRWAAEGGSAGILPGAVEDFHREMAPRLAARGWLRLYVLRVGAAAIAAVYGIEVGRRFSYYQSGYDPSWSARSPGLVLVGRTIEDAYARGLADYDFLRGTEAYKLDWAWDRRETCTLHVHAPSLRAGADALARDAWRSARGVARSVAPDRVWQALRRARRGLDARALETART
jgi:CelD/BcsL family acetyltransferase involved in cellulose biosynthesis